MSVIITIADKNWTQGYTTGTIYVPFTNSGTESVKNVRLKVVDSVVFQTLQQFYGSSWYSCLNTYGDFLNFTGGTLPAGQTKSAQLRAVIKAAAPIQTHNIQCFFGYEAY